MSNYNYNTLCHHGIKGQKWGIRRYQNDDGSLTSAGKARYNDDGTRKNPKDMTDEDLRKSSNRLSAEQNYKRLVDNDKPATRIGKTALKTLVASGATFAATYSASRIYANVANNPTLTRGKSALLAAMASIGTAAGFVGGRVGQTNVNQKNNDDDNNNKNNNS